MQKKKPPVMSQSGTASYRDGPPEINFAGRRWLRGIAQPIVRADFEALQARPDAAPFAFTFTGSAASAAPADSTHFPHSEE